jgi:hypothetical protein
LAFFRVVVDGVAIFNFGGAIKIRQPPARKRDKGRGPAEQKHTKHAGEDKRVSPLSSAESDLTCSNRFMLFAATNKEGNR